LILHEKTVSAVGLAITLYHMGKCLSNIKTMKCWDWQYRPQVWCNDWKWNMSKWQSTQKKAIHLIF